MIRAFSNNRDYVIFTVKGKTFDSWLKVEDSFDFNTKVFAAGDAFGEGIVVRETYTIGAEYLYAWLARWFPRDMALSERVRWISVGWFCLGIPLLSLWLQCLQKPLLLLRKPLQRSKSWHTLKMLACLL